MAIHKSGIKNKTNRAAAAKKKASASGKIKAAAKKKEAARVKRIDKRNENDRPMKKNKKTGKLTRIKSMRKK